MVHRRTVQGQTLVFGNQGALWQYAMTWWDHDTGSIWSQPKGQALAGPLKGQKLELLSSQFTSWGSWKQSHPETLALDAPGDATAFDLRNFYIVVEINSETRAYAISDLRQVRVVNDTVAGSELVVVVDPADDDQWAVFGRTIGDQTVDLAVDDGQLVDQVSGSLFDPITGRAMSGLLEGETLPRLPALTVFPGGGPTRIPIFDAFWPEGTVWRPRGP